MKTPKILGLTMAVAFAVLTPSMAMAQKKDATAVSEASRKQGMAGAPALVQSMGLPCQVSDARLMGEDKKKKVSLYEVACAPGTMGFVIQTAAEAAPAAFSCVEVNTPPAGAKAASTPCLLPGNADTKAPFGPLLEKAKVQCAPTAVRGIGQTKTNTLFEVQCAGGTGYVVTTSAPVDASKDVTAQNCILYDEAETNVKCELVDKVARMAVVDNFAKAGASTCVVTGRRFVGAFRDGSSYFEASCQDGKGYIFKTNSAGGLAETVDCVKAASMVDGGCKLTDTRQAQTEQAQLYTRLAKTAGATCDVERYALFPAKPGEENVELVCKGGSGAIGLFKAAANASQVVDCARAPLVGFACSLSKDSSYSALTGDLRRVKPDATSCEVSKAAPMGRSSKGTVFMEVACADGLKGYVIEYEVSPKISAVAVTNCALAANCKLPGNT